MGKKLHAPRDRVPAIETQGWAIPGNARKAHFFEKGEAVSNCGRWLFTGEREDSHHDDAGNCVECMKGRSAQTPETPPKAQ